jgi:hypothetical protein
VAGRRPYLIGQQIDIKQDVRKWPVLFLPLSVLLIFMILLTPEGLNVSFLPFDLHRDLLASGFSAQSVADMKNKYSRQGLS